MMCMHASREGVSRLAQPACQLFSSNIARVMEIGVVFDMD